MLFCICLRHLLARCPTPAAKLAHGQRNHSLCSLLRQQPTFCGAATSRIFVYPPFLRVLLGRGVFFSREAHLFCTDVSSCDYLKTCLFVPHKATICRSFLSFLLSSVECMGAILLANQKLSRELLQF